MENHTKTRLFIQEEKRKKTFFRMMTVLSLFVFITINSPLLVNASSKEANVSIHRNNVELVDVLNEIEKQSDYLFVYNNELDVTRKVTVKVKNQSVSKLLSQLLHNTDAEYTFEGTHIVLKKKEISGTSSVQQTKRIVTGTVKDALGEPIIGANVVEKGTTNGVITDIDGNFSISVGENSSLQISYIGYLPQEMIVANQTSIPVVLKEDTQTLEEVVVVGYGTVKKSDLTGSVASVSNKQFKDQPVKRVQDILQGRTSGVEVTTLSGMPGGSVKVRIRGTTSINKSSDPLYIVDGIFSSTGLDAINPADIQSVEVLKDASATAIYGSRGANGVVMITTRKGREGTPQITFDAAVGVSNMAKKYDLLNAYEYATALNDIWGSSTISPSDLEAYKNGTKGIDWQDLVSQTGISHDYKISVSGGNAKNKYLLSGNVLDMSAITITTKTRRYQFRANLDSEIASWLNIATKLNFARTQNHNNAFDLMNAINFSPSMEIKDEKTGIYNIDPFSAVGVNPYGARIVNYNDTYKYLLNGNVNLLFNIIDGLTLSVQGGINYEHAPIYSFSSKIINPGAINRMSNSSNINLYWQNTNNLTYQKSFGDHHLNLTAVWEVSNIESTKLSASGSNLSNENVGYWNIGNAKTINANNGYSSESIVSGIGRVMYNYKGRYMLTGTIRSDGSSKFQGNNKWGYFPSTAIAWDVAKEEFMSTQTLFQQLKLRASYGVIGNQDIGRYSTLSMLTSTSYGWGTSTDHTGYWANSFATPDLRWEKTFQTDIGLDFSILSGRLNFSVDWFSKQTKDLLFLKTVPSYNGGGAFWVNQGEITNKGVEFSVNAHLLNNNKTTWEATFNASYLQNKVVDLAGDPFVLQTVYSNYGGAMQIMKPGYPLGSFFLYDWQGFDDEGANLYKKADGSLTTSPMADDQIIVGQANPKWTFGFNNMVSWGNWSASLFFNGAIGGSRLNMTRYATASMTGMFRFIALRDAYYKGWDKVEDKKEAQFPSHTNTNTKYYGNSTFWLEDASFLKLKNISIAYTIPKKTSKIGDLQLSISGQNLFTLTKYKGLDPEVYNSGVGLDYGAYPVARTFTFGVKVNF